MKMKTLRNKKGFFLTETLMVVVFIAGIFTFLYVSIIPLIGKYNDLAYRENNLDIVYKLFHLRSAMNVDNGIVEKLNEDFVNVSCNDFTNQEYCSKLIEYLDLTDYNLLYVNSIKDNLDKLVAYPEIYDYVEKNNEDKVLLLQDKKLGTIAMIKYYDSALKTNVMGSLPTIIKNQKNNITEVQFVYLEPNKINERYLSATIKADVSHTSDESVMAFIEDDRLVIASSGITSLSSGYELFKDFSHVTKITFNNVDTSNVTDMRYMFSGCESLLSIDLSGFITNNVEQMDYMFSETGLKTIYVKDFSLISLISSNDMFLNSNNLQGENGTSYDSSYVDSEYARVDGILKGYFTFKG